MTRRLVRTLAAFALVLPFAAACFASQSEREQLEEAVAINRSLWEAQRPDHYRYVLRHTCFCAPAAIGPVEIEVQGGSVASRRYVESGEPVPEDLAEVFPSVSGLFDVLQEALDTGADEIEVTWDPVLGYPREFFIDYQVNVADEEQGYAVVGAPQDLAPPGEEGQP